MAQMCCVGSGMANFLFHHMDQDRDGYVSLVEFTAAVHRLVNS